MFNWTIKQERIIRIIILLFYMIGGIGIITPRFSLFFIKLTPIVLISSFILLMMFHHGGIKKSTLLNFILIYIISFLIEVVGVNTGLIFGEYTYGQTLGLKISNTPVIIGLNWVLLVYLTSSIVEKYNISNLLKILVASFLMLVYDIVLEKVAPLLDLWQFSKNVVPVENYIAWLIIAIFFHTLIKIFRIHTINRLSRILFLSQLIFLIFIAINLI